MRKPSLPKSEKLSRSLSKTPSPRKRLPSRLPRLSQPTRLRNSKRFKIALLLAAISAAVVAAIDVVAVVVTAVVVAVAAIDPVVMVSADHAVMVSAEVAAIDPELPFPQLVRMARSSTFQEALKSVVDVVVRMLLKESLVRKLIHSIVMTALVVADVVTRRVATERATGARMPKLLRMP
jgi:hypothetical protein